jgi:hypothetical protein
MGCSLTARFLNRVLTAVLLRTLGDLKCFGPDLHTMFIFSAPFIVIMEQAPPRLQKDRWIVYHLLLFLGLPVNPVTAGSNH